MSVSRSVSLSVCQSVFSLLLRQRVNLGRIRTDVDALWNLAPHDVSIIQYLLDYRAPESVQRMGMDFIQDRIEDAVFLHMSMRAIMPVR